MTRDEQKDLIARVLARGDRDSILIAGELNNMAADLAQSRVECEMLRKRPTGLMPDGHLLGCSDPYCICLDLVKRQAAELQP